MAVSWPGCVRNPTWLVTTLRATLAMLEERQRRGSCSSMGPWPDPMVVTPRPMAALGEEDGACLSPDVCSSSRPPGGILSFLKDDKLGDALCVLGSCG
jgi:hypothetical protein